MGFTIENYSLFGLQPQSFYVSIRGCFNIEKNNIPSVNGPIWIYNICYTVYYSASKEAPCAQVSGRDAGGPYASEDARAQVITQKQMIYNIQELPEPADIYSVIYANIKSVLGDLQYIDD